MNASLRLGFMLCLLMPATAFAGHEHAPFLTKDCYVCHKLDAAGNAIPDQFLKNQPDLCYQCHEPMRNAPYTHGALESGQCTDCHGPHEAPERFLLRAKVPVLCAKCHDAPDTQFSHKHAAIEFPLSCARCHSPHQANYPKLLRDPRGSCTYCHKDVGKQLQDPTMNIHPPLKDGCISCHGPHGSNTGKLLTGDINDLCLGCHDKNKFVEGHPQRGHSVSGGRDPLFPQRPFTCISCHKPHFSKYKKLFRYNVTPGETPYDGTLCSVCHWQNSLPTQPPRPRWDE